MGIFSPTVSLGLKQAKFDLMEIYKAFDKRAKMFSVNQRRNYYVKNAKSSRYNVF